MSLGLGKFREFYIRVGRVTKLIYFSKAFLIFYFSKALEFLKGFFALYAADYVLADPYLMVPTVGIALIAHNWSLFLKFKNRKRFAVILYGMYCFMFPWMLIIYPVCYFGLSVLFNSFLVGLLANVILQFFVIWYFVPDPVFLPVNFVIFLITFISHAHDIFQHFDHKRFTILESFERR